MMASIEYCTCKNCDNQICEEPTLDAYEKQMCIYIVYPGDLVNPNRVECGKPIQRSCRGVLYKTCAKHEEARLEMHKNYHKYQYAKSCYINGNFWKAIDSLHSEVAERIYYKYALQLQFYQRHMDWQEHCIQTMFTYLSHKLILSPLDPLGSVSSMDIIPTKTAMCVPTMDFAQFKIRASVQMVSTPDPDNWETDDLQSEEKPIDRFYRIRSLINGKIATYLGID